MNQPIIRQKKVRLVSSWFSLMFKR